MHIEFWSKLVQLLISTKLIGPLLILWLLIFSQLYRLCWTLRNRTEERIDLEEDDWTGDQDSSSTETEGILAYSIQYSTVQ